MACLPCPPARLPAYQEAAQAASHSSSSPNPPATRRPRPSLPPHSAGSGSIGDRSCAQLDASTQDGLLAYGPTAARALRADYQVLGFSGATVVVPRIRCATHRAPSPPLFWQQAAWKAAPRRCPAGRMLLGSMRPEGCQKAAPPPPPAGHGGERIGQPSAPLLVLAPPCRSGKDWTEAVQRLYQPRMQDLLPKADALGPSPPYNLSAFVPEVRRPCGACCRVQQRLPAAAAAAELGSA